MKPQKFSIHDILTRSPTVSGPKSDSTKTKIDDKNSQCVVSLPTPPQSPETEAICVKKSDVSSQNISSREYEHKTCQKRKRDPIGQILDSLCSKSEKKPCQTPSAFSPIITTPSSPQLSPLSLLSQNERRCIQTSPNIPCTNYQQPVTNEAYNKSQISREQLQSMEAQKMFQIQQLHHHHQQARLYQRQHQLQNQNFNSSHLPFYANAGVQRVLQYPQIMSDRQAQLLAMDSYNRSLILNSHNTGIVDNTAKFAGHSPFLLSWLKLANTMDQMSPIPPAPVKESRILPPPRYQCDACKKSYSTFGGLSKHKQFHCISHVKKEFNCKYCEKSYGSLGALKMHIRTHTLPCKCKLCGKAFSRPWLLQGHVRTHTGEKPFSCAHCGRAFADRSNLRAHLQTHSDIKKYACKNCTKTFSRMSLLLKHEEGSCMGLRR